MVFCSSEDRVCAALQREEPAPGTSGPEEPPPPPDFMFPLGRQGDAANQVPCGLHRENALFNVCKWAG